MVEEKVVVHFADGRTLSGLVEDFRPSDGRCEVRDPATRARVLVDVSDVKMVCFVRSLTSSGVTRHREAPPLVHAEGAGRRVEMVFRDGERLGGLADLREKPQLGFFLMPLNPQSNNLRIYVNPSQIVSFRFVT